MLQMNQVQSDVNTVLDGNTYPRVIKFGFLKKFTWVRILAKLNIHQTTNAAKSTDFTTVEKQAYFLKKRRSFKFYNTNIILSNC